MPHSSLQKFTAFISLRPTIGTTKLPSVRIYVEWLFSERSFSSFTHPVADEYINLDLYLSQLKTPSSSPVIAGSGVYFGFFFIPSAHLDFLRKKSAASRLWTFRLKRTSCEESRSSYRLRENSFQLISIIFNFSTSQLLLQQKQMPKFNANIHSVYFFICTELPSTFSSIYNHHHISVAYPPLPQKNVLFLIDPSTWFLNPLHWKFKSSLISNNFPLSRRSTALMSASPFLFPDTQIFFYFYLTI